MIDDIQNLVDHCKHMISTASVRNLCAALPETDLKKLNELLTPFNLPEKGGPATIRMIVPTYNGGHPDYDSEDDGKPGKLQEYGAPLHEIAIQRSEGVRVVFPSDDGSDVLVERQHDKWVVFLHPDGGDPEVLIYLHDDRAKPFQVLSEGGAVLLEKERS
jgi:hypothetical protein